MNEVRFLKGPAAPIAKPECCDYEWAALAATDSSAPPLLMWGFRVPTESPPAGTPPVSELGVPAISISGWYTAACQHSSGFLSELSLLEGCLTRLTGPSPREIVIRTVEVGLIEEGEAASRENRSIVIGTKLRDGWTLIPTNTICKGAKNCTPSPFLVNVKNEMK